MDKMDWGCDGLDKWPEAYFGGDNDIDFPVHLILPSWVYLQRCFSPSLVRDSTDIGDTVYLYI